MMVDSNESNEPRDAAKTSQDLIVCQKAHRLVLEAYRLTRRFPDSEAFGLTSQLRRSAVSVPANIAEGFKRRGPADKARFMNVAAASLEECRYYLILAQDLGYAETEESTVALEEISRLLTSYEGKIRTTKQN